MEFQRACNATSFLLVLFAALTSAISLVETLVSIVHDGLQCSKAPMTSSGENLLKSGVR